MTNQYRKVDPGRRAHFYTPAGHRRTVKGWRTRRRQATFMRIVELLPGGLERCTEKFAKGLHEILEDVLR